MIQDIYPSKLNNQFTDLTAEGADITFVFNEKGELMARSDTDGGLILPDNMLTRPERSIYLFSIDAVRYFLAMTGCDDATLASAGYEPYPVRKLRDRFSGKELYASFTAYHLWKWYHDNRFCGVCGAPLETDHAERALRCNKCGNIVYPRINPAVIVGVTDNDRIIITQYKSGYAHNALIAGFCEIGETLEETVAREVMEEAGVRVKNIRYYKSQPWGMAQDILMGFYCDVDGSTAIRMDEGELRSAVWTEREDIVLQPGDLSLTNEMMRMFKENRI
ncbi:MAG: NAD(+) diphosphatase [Lachnospiraceae bacterium]|nr:NAD(+) diphosphatase [Lachnospiraceae bacterium]